MERNPHTDSNPPDAVASDDTARYGARSWNMHRTLVGMLALAALLAAAPATQEAAYRIELDIDGYLCGY
jgi:hypothetical protein